MAELTEALLDGLPAAAAADGTVDLRRHFAHPLPMSVICELLGVDPGLRDRLHELSNLIVSTTAAADGGAGRRPRDRRRAERGRRGAAGGSR